LDFAMRRLAATATCATVLLAVPVVAHASPASFGPGDALDVSFMISALPADLTGLAVNASYLFPSVAWQGDELVSTELGEVSLYRDGALLADGVFDNWAAGLLGAFSDAADASASAVALDLSQLQAGAYQYVFRFAVVSGTLDFDPATISLSLDGTGFSYFPMLDPVILENTGIPEPPAAALLAAALALTLGLARRRKD
jgi:hypothetical protein